MVSSQCGEVHNLSILEALDVIHALMTKRISAWREIGR
jgi:hypothetical protein